MRAGEPDRSGYAVRSGVRLYYQVFGDGPGSADRIVDHRAGLALAQALCPVEVFDGGQCERTRHPVRFNLLVRPLVEAGAGARA